MKSETAPITDDEYLLRRVRVEQFRTTQVPLVSPNAFEPRLSGRDPDTDGISFYRASCLADPADVLAQVPATRCHEYGIVRISVAFLRNLGLSVVNKPALGIKGHVVVAELNATDYRANKARFTTVKLRLAQEASREVNLVRRPQPGEAP